MEDAYSATPTEIVEYLDRFVVGQKLANNEHKDLTWSLVRIALVLPVKSLFIGFSNEDSKKKA